MKVINYSENNVITLVGKIVSERAEEEGSIKNVFLD